MPCQVVQVASQDGVHLLGHILCTSLGSIINRIPPHEKQSSAVLGHDLVPVPNHMPRVQRRHAASRESHEHAMLRGTSAGNLWGLAAQIGLVLARHVSAQRDHVAVAKQAFPPCIGGVVLVES